MGVGQQKVSLLLGGVETNKIYYDEQQPIMDYLMI